ncbi:MAG: ribosome maturation factor RimP [Acidimicrobiales bacterium]
MGDELSDLLAPVVAVTGLELVDVELSGPLLRVIVDGPGGVSLDRLSELTRSISAALEGHDPLPGQRYTLEVSSPGVERPLRIPRHFARAVGERVTVRAASGGEGERRINGILAVADDEHIEVRLDDGGVKHLRYDQIDRARTVFDWGPPAKSGRGNSGTGATRAAGRSSDRKRVATP